MVSTRGNPVTDSGRQSSLPSRESRRSTRGTLQEPNDELFWEDSDDQISRVRRRTRSVNVTFKDATSPRSASSRSPEPLPRRSLPLKRPDEVAGIEGDTDTDDEVYRRSQSRRTRGQRDKNKKSPRKKVYLMNGDNIGDDSLMEDDIGLRRSLRRRKYKEFDEQSWLVGNKKLRGYPAMVPSSEPENDEPRPARKLRRHMSTDAVMVSRSRSSRFRPLEPEPRQRSCRRYSGGDDEELVKPSLRTRRPRRISSPKSDNSDEIITTRRRGRAGDNSDEEITTRRRGRAVDNSDEEITTRRRGRAGDNSDEEITTRRRGRAGDNSDEETTTRRRGRAADNSDEEVTTRRRGRAADNSDEEVTTRRRGRTVIGKYREEPENTEEEEDEDCKRKTRFSVRRTPKKEAETCKLSKKLDEIKTEPVIRKVNKMENEDENDDTKDETSVKRKVIRPRRRMRTRSISGGEKSDNTEDDDEEHDDEDVESKDEEDGDEEEEDDEQDESFKESPQTRKRGHKDTVIASAIAALKDHELEDIYSRDMYSRVKRERRPVKRFMYEDDVQEQRGRVRKRSSSDDSDNKDEEDDDDDDEDEEEDEEEDGAQIGSRYSLRQNRRSSRPFQVSAPDKKSRSRDFREQSPRRRECRNHKRYVNSPARKHIFHRKRRAAHTIPSGDSSSSDESHFEKRKARSMAKSRNRCLPMNMSPEELSLSGLKERSKIGSSLADIDPMSLDRSISFESIGGLSCHLKSLKEMVIFPLLYPEVFERFDINPPRGVLFHGPPGTGKTLVARALANECSIGERKVAFFMRKGADCLSKWVGESERQLRLLFDQAYQMRPSIIFFDEIDGLAPVRSSRQDQIHSSIVSTLLALMDGLDSRGEVVVIGATNRIDAIDPALRRPGRFDREFHFPLPSVKARHQILKIHTHKWQPVPSKKVLNYLAQNTVGYCGADLKSLCAEATLVALRTKFPQIYQTKQKLLIDLSQVNVKLGHFRIAMSKIIAAGQRSVAAVGRRLNTTVQPLLQSTLDSSLKLLTLNFPQAFSKAHNVKSFPVHRPRLILTGLSGQGQSTHLGPAIVHVLEKIPTHKLDLTALYSVSARAPEEACAQVFHEARRSLPCIVYVPHIDKWWGTTSDTLRATFTSLLQDIDPASPFLLLATSDVPYDELDEDVQVMFSVYHNEVFAMANPTEDERRQFFKPLFYTNILHKPKVRTVKRAIDDLPLAPPPPQHQLNSKEMHRLEELEEATLRELRIFLREICAKLARNRTFYMFTKPVDEEEVPDYREIIREPMDLETMMTKIDQHQYECAQEFLNDIDLICNNALEYNPDRNPEDKIIRHRACTMRDTAYAYIKAEMDTDFEYRCRDIRDGRKKRYTHKVNLAAPNFIHVAKIQNQENGNVKHKSGCSSEPITPLCSTSAVRAQRSKSDSYKRKKRRYGSWSRGEIPRPKRKRLTEKDAEKREGNEFNSSKDDLEEEKKHSGEDNEDKKNSDDDKKNTDEDSEESEEEVSVHSTDNSDGLSQNRLSSEVNQIHSDIQVSIDAEVALFNGHLSTEDSHDSMRVTSAADELAAKASASNLTKDVREDVDDRSLDTTVETEDSVVSSSEQGGGNPTEKNGVLVDWNHLQAVYESCISATDNAMIDDLQRLQSSLMALIKKHITSVNRTHLLQEMEAEIRRFAQFHKKS